MVTPPESRHVRFISGPLSAGATPTLLRTARTIHELMLHPVGARRRRHERVEFRSEAKIQLPRERPPGLDAVFLAPRGVFVDRAFEFAAQLFGVRRLEGCDRVGTAVHDPSVQHLDGVVAIGEDYSRDASRTNVQVWPLERRPVNLIHAASSNDALLTSAEEPDDT